MAHVGRFYPVAFRRDFNLNTRTNNLGWARRYVGYITLPPFVGVGGIVSGVDFDCGPDDATDPLQIDWLSAYKQLGVAKYRMELLVQIINAGQFLRQTAIEVLNEGIILVLTWADQRPGLQPGFGYDPLPEITYWSADWFDREPTTSTVTIAPKVWASPAPH